jgi:hypothetical protein
MNQRPVSEEINPGDLKTFRTGSKACISIPTAAVPKIAPEAPTEGEMITEKFAPRTLL